MLTIPQTYTEGMEEIVKWANGLDESTSKRFMLDLYKMYMEWRYILETQADSIFSEQEVDNIKATS